VAILRLDGDPAHPELLRISRPKREWVCRVLPRSPKRTAASIRLSFWGLSGGGREGPGRNPNAAVKVESNHKDSYGADPEEGWGMIPGREANFASRNRDPDVSPSSFHNDHPCPRDVGIITPITVVTNPTFVQGCCPVRNLAGDE
jgi:hypothetical protein